MKYILPILLILFFASQSFAQTTRFSSFKQKEEVNIYPNPCRNNKVTIDYHSNNISEVRLTNIAGNQVYLKKYDLPTPKIELKLEKIPNGVYLIQITTTQNTHTVKKLLISRN